MRVCPVYLFFSPISVLTMSDHIENNFTEVFRGNVCDVALVQSLLGNAEINTYVRYGGEGNMAPWDSRGCFPLIRIMVSGEDHVKAKEVIDQYYEALKE